MQVTEAEQLCVTPTEGGRKAMSPPRVLVEGTIFGAADARGIQRYFIELLRRVAMECQVTVSLPVEPLVDLPAGCRVLRLAMPEATHKLQLVRRARRLLSRRRQRQSARQHSVFHATYFSLSPSADLPTIVTVHDMIPESFPHLFAYAADQHIEQKRRAMEEASVCICISQSTADELTAFYPNFADKVRVIYDGAEHLGHPSGFLKGPPSARSSMQYALYVGGRSRYKNFPILLEAAASADWPSALKVRVVGPPFSASEDLLLRRLGLTTVIQHCGRVDDATLQRLYCDAECLVTTSFMEGFGFPGLEAQAAGCAVACSDIAVYRETLDDAAVYFDPHDSLSLARAVRSLLNHDLKAHMRENGRKNVTRFQWDRCARETLRAYQDAARPGGKNR